MIWGQYIFDIFKLFVTPIASAFLAVIFVNRLKSRDDYIDRRIDEICADARAIADFSADYWMKDQELTLVPVESKIQTRMQYLSRLFVDLSNSCPELNGASVQRCLGVFFRDSTGGDFGVHNRVKDVDRVRSVYHSCSRLTEEVRRARMTTHSNLVRFF